jgi:hypothetical protein
MKPTFLLAVAATTLFAAGISNAQSQNAGSAQKQGMEGQGQAIITVVPSHSNDAERTIQISQQDVKEIKVAGKPSQITGWTSLRDQPLELVVLISSEARASFGNQLEQLTKFSQELPPQTLMAVAWMQNGRAVFASPLSSDPSQIAKGIHLPSGMSGANSSPYFSLSSLAKNWPSQNRHARREVVMITDGIDDLNPRYDPDDPYVHTAINDSVRSGLVVYSIFWPDRDRLARFGWAQDAGQNLLTQLTAATGGTNFWQGIGDPVALDPYLKDLRHRLNNQYAISFSAPLGNKPSVENFDLKISVPSAKVDTPKQVFVHPAAAAAE